MDHHHMLLRDDGAFVNPHTLKELTPSRDSSLLAFLPFLRDAELSLPSGGSTPSSCGDMMQAMTMRRPTSWPVVDVISEGVKVSSLSPDYSTARKHSPNCTSKLHSNVSTSSATMEKMRVRSSNEQYYSSEEVEWQVNEGESGTRKKRRLTEEQVRTLESSFEGDQKLDAERKQELAQRLGLEPRQVGVWFQNRRARSKAKHLEHDFTLLKSKYHYMLAEAQKLRSEISRLTAELEASRRGVRSIRTKAVDEQSLNQDSHHLLKDGKGDADHRALLPTGVMNQHTSTAPAPCPSTLSCSPESSVPDSVVEIKSGGWNSSPPCVSTEGDEEYNVLEHAPCGELLHACSFSTGGYMNPSSFPFCLPHLNKRPVSDVHHGLQAHLHSDECVVQPFGSRSHHAQAFDCL